MIAAHNGTHMDALAHVYADGQLYNGFPASTFTASKGAAHCGIEKTGGFATRAVLLDLPSPLEDGKRQLSRGPLRRRAPAGNRGQRKSGQSDCHRLIRQRRSLWWRVV